MVTGVPDIPRTGASIGTGVGSEPLESMRTGTHVSAAEASGEFGKKEMNLLVGVPTFTTELRSKSLSLEERTRPRDIPALIKGGDYVGLKTELARPILKRLRPSTWSHYIQIALECISKTSGTDDVLAKSLNTCLGFLLDFRYKDEEVLSGKSDHLLLLREIVGKEAPEDVIDREELSEEQDEDQIVPAEELLIVQVAKAVLKRFPKLAVHTYTSDNIGRSALHEIAVKGAVKILEVVITYTRKEDLITALSQADKTSKGGKTPLAIAIDLGRTRIPVIKRLVRFHPGLINEHGILCQAVEGKDLKVVEALVGECAELLPEQSEKAIDTAVRDGQIGIVKLLIGKCPSLLTSRLFDKIAQEGPEGRVDIWEYAQGKSRDEAATASDVLHIAVCKVNLALVESIMRTYPKLAVRPDKNGYSALYYNKHDEMGDERSKGDRKRIRDLLVEQVMKENDPLKIRALLSEENEKNPNYSKEICLDLAAFSEDTHDFAQLIELTDLASSVAPAQASNIQLPSGNKSAKSSLLKHLDVEFESTLLYVDFPDLDKLRLRRESSEKPRDLRYEYHAPLKMAEFIKSQRKEVKHVLDWLYQGRQVRKIIELKVPDSLHDPHTEETIIQSIKPFEIEKLDWKRLDLSIDCVCEAAENVEHLYLYGSGNMAVTSHWTGNEGVCRLKKLKIVEIVIMENLVGAEYAKQEVQRATKRLDKLKEDKLKDRLKEDTAYKWEHKVTSSQWNESPSIDNRRISRLSKKATPVVLTKLEKFLEFYRSYQQQYKDAYINRNTQPNSTPAAPAGDLFLPTKVALVDTGANKSSFPQIKKGISFVYERRKESPWWLAIDPHGTQMADFVCKLDPHNELYIAKAGESQPNYLSVVESIRWAIKEKVDIISMSFAFEEDYSELREAIYDACLKEGIVIICSTADQGNNSSKVWPASYEEGPIAVAACNSYGKLAPFSSDIGAHYFFHGMDIATEMIPYMKSPQEISGSSVATAIAAGVASLILACHRIVYPNLKKNERKMVVNRHFKKMALDADNNEGRYVKPWEGLRVVQPLSKSGSGDRWLWNTFKDKKMGEPAPRFVKYWRNTQKDNWQ